MEYEEIRIQGIVESSSVDGVGFRDVLFVNGCPHRCEGCHNPETWEEKNGKLVSADYIYEALTKSSVTNVTLSGGEPFMQADKLIKLVKKIKKNTGKTFWIYSGYLFEEIIADPQKRELLELCEVLVDGRFEIAKKGLNLRFKGSSNQRIIDIPKSLAQNRAVLWEDD